MKTIPVPYLCGGIFLVLLTEAKGKKTSPRQLKRGKKDRVSNRNMLEALIQFVVPSFNQPAAGRTFEGDTTDYRACKVSYGENLPFNDEVEIEAFDRRVRTQYISVLRQMNDFIDCFLRTESEEKMKWLFKAFLTIIDKDQSITSDTKIYMGENPIAKADILALDHYCLSSLLLGLWHYIVINRPDNEIGRSTFEYLHDRADVMNAKWKFKHNFGGDYSREFDFDLFADCGNEEEIKNAQSNKTDDADAEVIEAEVMDDPKPMETKTIIKEGRVYQQKAEKIYNIEHIENFYG